MKNGKYHARILIPGYEVATDLKGMTLIAVPSKKVKHGLKIWHENGKKTIGVMRLKKVIPLHIEKDLKDKYGRVDDGGNPLTYDLFYYEWNPTWYVEDPKSV